MLRFSAPYIRDLAVIDLPVDTLIMKMQDNKGSRIHTGACDLCRVMSSSIKDAVCCKDLALALSYSQSHQETEVNLK